MKSTAGDGSHFRFPFSLSQTESSLLSGSRRPPPSPGAFARTSEADEMMDTFASGVRVPCPEVKGSGTGFNAADRVLGLYSVP